MKWIWETVYRYSLPLMAKPYKRAGSKFWYIAPWIKGRQVPQSSGFTDYAQAERKLKVLEGKIADGAPINAQTDRETFDALLELVRADYQIKQRRSLYDTEKRIDLHISPRLGHLKTTLIPGLIRGYILSRRNEHGAKNATINRELAIIKRAFVLGKRDGMVSDVPYIEMLSEDEPRRGFFTPTQFNYAVTNSSALLGDILTVAYTTGWRIESILRLQWRGVDLARMVIHLDASETKNRKATTFPLEPFPSLYSVFERRLTYRQEIERRKELRIPYVFHRDGVPVRSIRKEWEKVRKGEGKIKEATLYGLMIHDLRRTAVRNLKSQGWSDTEVMAMVGLKTISMFLRYNITTEEDILNKAKAIAATTILK